MYGDARQTAGVKRLYDGAKGLRRFQAVRIRGRHFPEMEL